MIYRIDLFPADRMALMEMREGHLIFFRKFYHEPGGWVEAVSGNFAKGDDLAMLNAATEEDHQSASDATGDPR